MHRFINSHFSSTVVSVTVDATETDVLQQFEFKLVMERDPFAAICASFFYFPSTVEQ